MKLFLKMCKGQGKLFGIFGSLLFVFASFGFIQLLWYGVKEIENLSYIQSVCTVTNYTFVPRDGCYASWINIVTSEGANLIYWFATGVCDPAHQVRVYALRYTVGTSRTCFLRYDRWVWELSDTHTAFVIFIVFFSIAGAAAVGLIVIAIVECKRNNKRVPVFPAPSGPTHTELVENT
jgi:hypothetical protein